MDIVMYKKALDYVTRLYENPTEIRRIGAAYPKNVLCKGEPIVYPFDRATPDSVGIPSHAVTAFLREIEERPEICLHSLMIIKDDKVILECEKYPYRSELWHVSHSLCKSITSLAVGLMVDDGILSLDDKLSDIFTKRAFSLDFLKQNGITLRHLLTMSAGVTFNELGSATYEDYAEGFFAAGVKFAPGTGFLYNSMNSYMLSAAIYEKTGKDMFDILNERIFTPMGITEVFWEKCPRGITKGGWGLYMKLEDTAKFGKLFLDRGMWQGKRLISEKYLSEATKKQIDSSPAMCDFGYGYHIWRSIRSGSYQFNGMLGQNLIIFPDLHMIFVSFAGNNDFFPKSKLVSLVGKYFGDGFTPSEKRRPSVKELYLLDKAKKRLEVPRLLPRYKQKYWRLLLTSLVGKQFFLDPKTVSLLPLAVSVMHNNFESGVKSIRFMGGKRGISILFEMKKETLEIPIDISGRATYFRLAVGGDRFSVAALAKMAVNEDDTPVLKLSLHYLELTSVREIKLFFHRERLTVRAFEIPSGRALYQGFLPLLNELAGGSFALKKVLNMADGPKLGHKLDALFETESEATKSPHA